MSSAIVAITDRHLRDPESAFLDFGQETVQRSRLIQTGLLLRRRLGVREACDRREIERTKAFHRRRLPAARAALPARLRSQTLCRATG
jgi:hypothetical protein